MNFGPFRFKISVQNAIRTFVLDGDFRSDDDDDDEEDADDHDDDKTAGVDDDDDAAAEDAVTEDGCVDGAAADAPSSPCAGGVIFPRRRGSPGSRKSPTM